MYIYIYIFVDENEQWGKIEQMKGGGEEMMIIKYNFSRVGQQTLYDIAYQLGLLFVSAYK